MRSAFADGCWLAGPGGLVLCLIVSLLLIGGCAQEVSDPPEEAGGLAAEESPPPSQPESAAETPRAAPTPLAPPPRRGSGQAASHFQPGSRTVQAHVPRQVVLDTDSLPAPVSVNTAEGTETELSFTWPGNDALYVHVEIPAGAVPAGTEISLQPLPPAAVSGKLPGILVDDIAFRLLPEGLHFDLPVTVSVQYQSELSFDENYSLLYWDPARSRFDPMPIVYKDPFSNVVSFSLDHFSDYNLVYTFAEGLWLKKTGGGTWLFHLYFEGWPGLVKAQLVASVDGAPVALPPGTGLYFDDWVGHDEVSLSASGSAGKSVLDLSLEITQQIGDDPDAIDTYTMGLWQQTMVTEPTALGAADAAALLAKWAPVFQFAQNESYFPVSIESITSGVTEIWMPSGRTHYFPGGAGATQEMGKLGDQGAALVYKGKSIDTGPGPAFGTVYGQAFEVAGGTALLYALYFPWSQDLGPDTGTWGGHRGDVKYLLIKLAGGEPVSVTFSQHRPGVSVQYQGDPKMPVWMASSWAGSALTLPWGKTLRCKAHPGEDGNEEHVWVFVGDKTHALYPRAGNYEIQVPGKGPAFIEEAGGDYAKLWQPDGFGGACSAFSGYPIELHPLAGDATSGGFDGYLLFSGQFGPGRYGGNASAPYQQAWYDPAGWAASGASPAFDDGTNCYRCLPPVTMQTIDGYESSYCYQYMWICQCSSCGLAIANAFVHFPEGFQCNDGAFCDGLGLNGMCKTGVEINWYSDEPLNGVPYADQDLPQHAQVFVQIPYQPTCYSSAIMYAGVQAHVCSNEACCTQLYGSVMGECYPSF